MSKSQFRFVISGNGAPEPLFSISITKHRDVILTVKGFDKVRKLGLPTKMLGSDHHDEEVREFRFTIHPSKDSDRLNRINLHHVLKQGASLGFSSHTDAIKDQYAFAMLFSRHGRGLGLSKSKAKVVNIDNYDPSAFTVHWSVFVSHPEYALTNEYPTTNYLSEIMSGVRLTLLWSFLPLPSLPLGASTMAYGQIGDDTIYSLLHYSHEQAIIIHEHTAKRHHDELVETMMKSFVFESLEARGVVFRWLSRFACFKEGSKDSFAYTAFKDAHTETIAKPTTVRVLDVF